MKNIDRKRKKWESKVKNLISCFFCFSIVLLVLNGVAHSNSRFALVIGNADYEGNMSLSNPVNDANDVAAILSDELGFEVIRIMNASRQEMIGKRNHFFKRIDESVERGIRIDVALFYYAGHAVQYKGQNFLIPRGAKISEPEDLEEEGYNLLRILKPMENRKSVVNIAILDACRNNPFADKRGFRNYLRGLETENASRGLMRIDDLNSVLVAYSTAPGRYAEDGDKDQRNSPYTRRLKEYLPKPKLSLLELFNQVGLAVKEDTSGRQVPWTNNPPMKPLCLAGCDSGNAHLVVSVNRAAFIWQGNRKLGEVLPGDPLIMLVKPGNFLLTAHGNNGLQRQKQVRILKNSVANVIFQLPQFDSTDSLTMQSQIIPENFYNESSFENEDIYFNYDSSELTVEGQKRLEQKIQWLKDNIHMKFIIEGHTDERGSCEYNLALGEHHCRTISKFLIDEGIDPSRITMISYGAEKPIDENHNEKAWAKNRRVHFVTKKR